MNDFTHLDEKGSVRMVDVSGKEPTFRTAVAEGRICMTSQTLDQIRQNGVKKGNVLETARIAGIMAAKKTSDLIPMCHPLHIASVRIDFSPENTPPSIGIRAEVHLTGQTGVEMEAMIAVSIAALTIYDMCKSLDREMTISDIRLVEKTGGKSGTFKINRPAFPPESP